VSSSNLYSLLIGGKEVGVGFSEQSDWSPDGEILMDSVEIFTDSMEDTNVVLGDFYLVFGGNSGGVESEDRGFGRAKYSKIPPRAHSGHIVFKHVVFERLGMSGCRHFEGGHRIAKIMLRGKPDSVYVDCSCGEGECIGVWFSQPPAGWSPVGWDSAMAAVRAILEYDQHQDEDLLAGRTGERAGE